MVDELKRIQNVGVVALIVGLSEGRWKVSLRGPPPGCRPDRAALRRRGHAKAAGYRVDVQSLETLPRRPARPGGPRPGRCSLNRSRAVARVAGVSAAARG